jgi:hypothetical protein
MPLVRTGIYPLGIMRCMNPYRMLHEALLAAAAALTLFTIPVQLSPSYTPSQVIPRVLHLVHIAFITEGFVAFKISLDVNGKTDAAVVLAKVAKLLSVVKRN